MARTMGGHVIASFGEREIRPLRVWRTKVGYLVLAELREGDDNWRSHVTNGFRPRVEWLTLPRSRTLATLVGIEAQATERGRNVELRFVEYIEPRRSVGA
jgi:hypothetical protein